MATPWFTAAAKPRFWLFCTTMMGSCQEVAATLLSSEALSM